MISGSTRALALIKIPEGRPARWWADSRWMSSRRRGAKLKGATRSSSKWAVSDIPVRTLKREATSEVKAWRQVSRLKSV